MVCSYCGGPTAVSNSRPLKRLNGVWRRRVCKQCASIVTTVEQVDLGTALRIQRSAGHLEPFSRDKLYISLYESLGHRKTAQEDAALLCDTVTRRIIKQAASATCPINLVIEAASEVLAHFDEAAVTHYRAYHPLEN